MDRKLAILAEAAWRSWLVFCVVAYVGALMDSLLESPRDLLRSDDPYIAGAFFGSVAGIGAGVFWLVRHVSGRTWAAHTACAVCLAVWCLLHVAVALGGGEGRNIAAFVAVGSGIAALSGWPMFDRRFPWPVATAISTAGVLFLAAWFVVVESRMRR